MFVVVDVVGFQRKLKATIREIEQTLAQVINRKRKRIELN